MQNNYDVIVIGSGFGGTITALTIAREFYLEHQKDRNKPLRKVLLLERGTWWTTPVGTVQDKEVAAYTLLKKYNKQPVQFWSSDNGFRGAIDLLTRCFHREGNVDGLYELTRFGTSGILGFLRRYNDGLTVLRACGVGGGSLVYSNITVQPPNLIFKDSRWNAMTNWLQNKEDYYDAARTAIGTGILAALLQWDKIKNPNVYSWIKQNDPTKSLQNGVNSGLSRIVTRTADQNPHWKQIKDENGNWKIPHNAEGKKIFQIDRERETKNPNSPDLSPFDDKRDFKNDLWLDKARIYQSGMKKMVDKFNIEIEYSAHELSINDYDSMQIKNSAQTEIPGSNLPDGFNQFNDSGAAKNYCERQGRCNVGCLPGARHTLSKQLTNAIYGTTKLKRDSNGVIIKDKEGNAELEITDGIFKDILTVKALCEVEYINKLNDFDYEVHYYQHAEQSLKIWNRKKKEILRTKRLVVAAGCLGTNEIMLRSVAKGGLKNLSTELGNGFSTNGDMIYFLPYTKERVRSTRGPVQTSHGHFNLSDTGVAASTENLFHMIEDLGIPPAFATTLGFGKKLFSIIVNGKHKLVATAFAIVCYLFKKAWAFVSGPWKNRLERQEMFQNEDEVSSNILVITTTGRERARGKITLGGFMQTPLRIKRTDEFKRFSDDPVYRDIEKTLDKMAQVFTDDNIPESDKKFVNPSPGTIGLSHPLGGCRIGSNAEKGVVDEFGHVFDNSKSGDRPFHEGLFIADASVIPTALGVNPSLSISAVCWQIADNIRKEL